MKFALIWSREVESRALAILGPCLTRKERKRQSFSDMLPCSMS